MSTETREVAICRPGEDVTEWRPWRNCRTEHSVEQTACMALHQYLRLGGYTHKPAGVRQGFEPFELAVYVATPADQRHADGRPMTCHGFTFRVGPS